MARIVVIGAGMVGLSCAYALRREAHEVTILDRDPAGDKASVGNAGGIGVTEIVPASTPGLLWRVPGWLLDPLGPLWAPPGPSAASRSMVVALPAGRPARRGAAHNGRARSPYGVHL